MAKTLTIIRLRFLRTWKVMVGVALVGTALAVGAWELDLLGLRGSELGAYDDGLNAFTHKPWFPWGQVDRSSDLVIVAIDDKTFEEVSANESYRTSFGYWPYSRNVWAIVFSHLVDEGAKLVVFDAVMNEPHTDPSGDLAMAQVIAEKRVPFYLGFSVLPKTPPLPKVEPKNRLPEPPVVGAPAEEKPEPETVPAAAETFPAAEETFPGEAEPKPAAEPTGPDPTLLRTAQAYALPIVAEGGLSLPSFGSVELTDELGQPSGQEEPLRPLKPLEPLIDITPGFGAVTLEADDDGKMRRTWFAYTDGVNTYPTLALAVAADYFKAEKITIAPRRLTLGDHVVPINPDGSAEINYGGDLFSRYRTVSLINVLDDFSLKEASQPRKEAMKGLFKDKVVVIAGFAIGTADVKPTPFSNNSPGVAKHVAEIENLLHAAFITEAPYWVSIALAFAVAFFSVMIITVVRSTLLEIGWPLLLFFGFFTLTGSFLVLTKTHVLSALPTMAGELASVAAVAFNHLFARKDREHLREMFQAYMDRDLVEQMVEQRELPKLDGEHYEVSALFSDIRGFSSISERMKDQPLTLLRLLNTYLTRVTPALKAHGACIDKYIGDAVVCLFGAPVKTPHHAVEACRAALEMQAEVGRIREDFRRQGLPDVYTRIGINTDVMLVGNIGSADLLDYTAIGDGMNLAARLEGANKAYDTLILIGPRTFALAREQIEARELDWVRVAGKNEPVAVYELLALKGGLSESKRQVCALYGRALALFRQRRFADALPLLSEALALDPEDGPSRALAHRCTQYAKQPPPESFDGVVALEK